MFGVENLIKESSQPATFSKWVRHVRSRLILKNFDTVGDLDDAVNFSSLGLDQNRGFCSVRGRK